MWANNVKPRKPSKNWHKRALLIDLNKTRLVFVEGESANSETTLPSTHSELIKAQQAPSCTDRVLPLARSELVETEQVQSSIDKSEINLAIQEFQLSVTYYADSLEEHEKGRFGFHRLGEVFSHIYALLA